MLTILVQARVKPLLLLTRIHLLACIRRSLLLLRITTLRVSIGARMPSAIAHVLFRSLTPLGRSPTFYFFVIFTIHITTRFPAFHYKITYNIGRTI
jgi:hypothetical protein